MNESIACAGCGAPVPPTVYTRSERRFCSSGCKERERNTRPRPCVRCGWVFSANSRHTNLCPWCRAGATEGPLPRLVQGARCRVRRPRKQKYAYRGSQDRPCVRCGVVIKANGKYQRAICAACKADTKKRCHRLAKARRKGRLRLDAVPYRTVDIFERDGYRCHLCGGRVVQQPVPHPRAATIDHLIPLVDGGADSPSNVATAHFLCNSKRGAKGVVQLRLVA